MFMQILLINKNTLMWLWDCLEISIIGEYLVGLDTGEEEEEEELALSFSKV